MRARLLRSKHSFLLDASANSPLRFSPLFDCVFTTWLHSILSYVDKIREHTFPIITLLLHRRYGHIWARNCIDINIMLALWRVVPTSYYTRRRHHKQAWTFIREVGREDMSICCSRNQCVRFIYECSISTFPQLLYGSQIPKLWWTTFLILLSPFLYVSRV